MNASEERVNNLFLSFVREHWRKLLIPLIAIVVLLAFLFFPQEHADHSIIVNGETNPLEIVTSDSIKEDIEPEQIDEPSEVIVDVQGAVVRPGVYAVEEQMRLIDVIQLAGGYLPEADTQFINHAMKLEDELFIYIPAEGEQLPEERQSPIISATQSSSAQEQQGVININTATEADLMQISGIGPAKASAIIEYREQHGLFAEPESIMNVSGIGQKTYEKLQQQISVK